MDITKAIDILTGGYPGNADFNMKTFLGNLEFDDELADMTATELEAEWQSWQDAHDA